MDQELTFSQVKQALEIATRVEKLREEVWAQIQGMTFKEDAVHRVSVNDASRYVALRTLSNILLEITKSPEDSWRGTKYGDCIKELTSLLR